jgi:hypothetical protein
MVRDANLLEKYIEFFILPSPISLHCNNFPIELALNILLKLKKSLMNIRTLFEQIYPDKLAKSINKAYIIGIFSCRERSRTPYIRKTCSKGTLDLLVEVG